MFDKHLTLTDRFNKTLKIGKRESKFKVEICLLLYKKIGIKKRGKNTYFPPPILIKIIHQVL